jgi:hypothetical protein
MAVKANSTCASYVTGLDSPLTTAFQSASITGCNVYYNDASQNLTTFDISATLDYMVSVNFTWNSDNPFDDLSFFIKFLISVFQYWPSY